MRHPVDLRPAHVVLREETRAAHEDTEASDGMRQLMAGELDEAGYAGLLHAQLGLFEAWEADRGAWLLGTVAAAGWDYVSRAGLLREDLGEVRRNRTSGGDLGIAHIVGSYMGAGSGVGAGSVVGAAGGVGAAGVRDLATVGAHDVGDPPPDTASNQRHALPDTASNQHHAPHDTASPYPAGITDTATAANTSAIAWGELYVVEGSALGGRLIARRLRELYPHRGHRFYAVGEGAPSAWRRFQHLLDTHLPDDASRRAAVDGATRMFARFHRTLKEPTHV